MVLWVVSRVPWGFTFTMATVASEVTIVTMSAMTSMATMSDIETESEFRYSGLFLVTLVISRVLDGVKMATVASGGTLV